MNLSIAYLEDSAADVLLLNSLVGDLAVITAYENYESYLKSNDVHDLVVSDLNMPDYSFKKLIAAMQKSCAPFFIYSDSSIKSFNCENLQYLKDQGVDAVFQKGADDCELVSLIKQMLRR